MAEVRGALRRRQDRRRSNGKSAHREARTAFSSALAKRATRATTATRSNSKTADRKTPANYACNGRRYESNFNGKFTARGSFGPLLAALSTTIFIFFCGRGGKWVRIRAAWRGYYGGVRMKIDRRNLMALLPAVIAEGAMISALGETAAAQAPNSTSAGAAKSDVVPSEVLEFDKLPVKKAATSTSRAILHGKLATGESIEVHETTLEPGGAPHPPHHHEHTEMFLMREGEAEVTISGKAQRVTAGGIAYVHSNDEHGITNKSDKPATYFVVAVGPGAA